MPISKETVIVSRTLWAGTYSSPDPIPDSQVDYPFIVQLAHDLIIEDDPVVELMLDLGKAHLHISRTAPNSFALSVIQCKAIDVIT